MTNQFQYGHCKTLTKQKKVCQTAHVYFEILLTFLRMRRDTFLGSRHLQLLKIQSQVQQKKIIYAQRYGAKRMIRVYPCKPVCRRYQRPLGPYITRRLTESLQTLPVPYIGLFRLIKQLRNLIFTIRMRKAIIVIVRSFSHGMAKLILILLLNKLK